MPTIVSDNMATAATLGITASLRVLDMKDKVYLLEPSKTPLTLLMNKTRRQSCKQPKIEWHEDERIPKIDRINNSGGYTAGATSLVVDNGGYFYDEGTFRVQRTGEVCLVTAVSTNTLTVTRSWGGTAAAALLDNDQLTILGGTYLEGADAGSSKQTKTAAKFNYTEIHRDQFGVTGTLNAAELYGGNKLAYLHKVRGIDHATAIELKMFFQERGIDTSGNEPRRSMGGLDEFISTNSKDFGGAIGSLTEIFDAAEDDLRYGRKSKMLFCGRAVSSNISLLAANVLRTVPSDKTFGINISRLETPHGVYMITAHDAFEGDTYKNRAYCVDMDNVAYRFLRGRDTKLRMNIQDNKADKRQDEYLTECSMERILEKTHGKWTAAAS